MKICDKCGFDNKDDAVFCLKCGHMIGFGGNVSTRTKPKPITAPTSSVDESSNTSFAVSVKPLNWKDLFINVFKKHTSQEAEDLFIYGTRRTTPPLRVVSLEWPKPWMYSRVLLGLVITFLLLKMSYDISGNINALPGVIFIGSLAFPLATAFLFMEVNVYRNISFYKSSIIFLIGGAASFFVTILLYALILTDDIELDYVGAMLVGIIEETGKFFIIFFFLKRFKNCNYILNGLLVGALVGAGFATFESAGYAFQFLLNQDVSSMYSVIYIRGFLSPGGHVAWSAMVGVAIILSKCKSCNDALRLNNVLSNKRFWMIMVIAIVLHFLWDSPMMSTSIIMYIILTIVAWVITLAYIQMGLTEVNVLTKKHYNI